MFSHYLFGFHRIAAICFPVIELRAVWTWLLKSGVGRAWFTLNKYIFIMCDSKLTECYKLLPKKTEFNVEEASPKRVEKLFKEKYCNKILGGVSQGLCAWTLQTLLKEHPALQNLMPISCVFLIYNVLQRRENTVQDSLSVFSPQFKNLTYNL